MPAMALGVTDHIGTIGELVAAALQPLDVPPLSRPTPDLARTCIEFHVRIGLIASDDFTAFGV